MHKTLTFLLECKIVLCFTFINQRHDHDREQTPEIQRMGMMTMTIRGALMPATYEYYRYAGQARYTFC